MILALTGETLWPRWENHFGPTWGKPYGPGGGIYAALDTISENAEFRLHTQQEVDNLHEIRMECKLSADEGDNPFMARLARVGKYDQSSKVVGGENVVVQSVKRPFGETERTMQIARLGKQQRVLSASVAYN